MSVAALPMSIWPHAMLYGRPSSEIDLVSPVIACFDAVYATLAGREGPGRSGAVTRTPGARPRGPAAPAPTALLSPGR